MSNKNVGIRMMLAYFSKPDSHGHRLRRKPPPTLPLPLWHCRFKELLPYIPNLSAKKLYEFGEKPFIAGFAFAFFYFGQYQSVQAVGFEPTRARLSGF